MKSKLNFGIVILSIFLTISALFCEERDYNQIFQTCKALITANEIKGESKKINPDEELKEILETGFNFFNVISPYTRAERNLKSIIKELASFQFTLRSLTSTSIYM